MERNRRSSHVYKIHLELENGPFNCGSFFLTKFKKHFKTSKNIDEVTCGNCKKLMMIYGRENSMPIRNGYREQERRRKRDERMLRWEQEVMRDRD